MAPESLTKIETSYVLSGIPVTHKDSHLLNFENKYSEKYASFWAIVVKTAHQFLKDPEKFPKFCFLCGTPGNGKTHYLTGLYRALVHQMGYSQGNGASFYTFSSLAQEIIAGFKDNIPTRTAMAAYTQPRFLFIDDFTSSSRILKKDSLEQTILRDIILDRYDKGCHLITSANISSAEILLTMEKFFGGYVTSRLADSRIIQFPPVDLRVMKG